jgi:phosphoenolpyruvate carboxykinase (ATP)
VDPVFGLRVPLAVPEVPSGILDPRQTWTDGEAYDAQAEKLAGMFRSNFEKYEPHVSREVAAAGPR